ncbi:glycosyltransferase [Agromyces cerinus]|uniref:Glycosyltransferase, MGT family n=1 Tax=Agromyces cerinus subsp. cerinus TaxID=232089 RepID=A0A1N6I6L5_9MICO|nr:nucleotide disphospho-sugar-binding domain-containing protein [Agromyces cerinus]SIO27609.1 glycosyltransferase, MGT family [Agromyces cerinus subsp. cerinus]
MSDDEADRPAARTYLFVLSDAGGTVPPEIGVARRLAERGHHVTVLADDPLERPALQAGARFRPTTGRVTEPFRDWAIRTPPGIARGMAEEMIVGPAPVQAADTAAAIDELRPELVVVSSFAVGAMIAAESRGVPFDLLIPNTYALPAKGMPPFGVGLAPGHGAMGALRDTAFGAAGRRLFDHYALAPLNAVRTDHDLDPVATMWNQMQHAHRQLVLTSAAFDFPAELPANARYVGPVLDDPSWAADETWTPPDGDDPLVLVAMSSTFQNHVECLQRITDALGELPVRGVVTTGPAVLPDAIRAPANVSVVASAPHRLVMREASLVVTHGGHGTVIKSLAAGLPLVILHHGRDQADNAVRVTERGAGVAISRRSSTQRIARAVGEVLRDDRYRLAAAKLGEVIARDAAGSALLDELEGPARDQASSTIT